MANKTTTDDIRKQLEQREQVLEADLASVRAALAGLSGQTERTPLDPNGRVADRLRQHVADVATGDGPRGVSRVTIGDDKLDTVRDYLRKQPGRQARQADIGKDTGLNTGIVSNAVTKLHQQHEIEFLGKRDRSNTWRLRRAGS